ncbi:hypothetical protein ACEPAI_4564 [Sanghuangporus weigelae]
MDVDVLPADQQAPGTPQGSEEDLLGSGGNTSTSTSPQEADTSDSESSDLDRDEPFRFEVPKSPTPALCRFEKELEESLRVEPMDGVLRDIRDGRIWKEARANDGSAFFSPSNPNAIRIGLILHFDGFGGKRARNGSSYSSGVLSYSIANLPIHLRYKPSNLLVVALSPGPKESTCDELQHLLKAVVDDKICLYEEGIEVKTPLRPNG